MIKDLKKNFTMEIDEAHDMHWEEKHFTSFGNNCNIVLTKKYLRLKRVFFIRYNFWHDYLNHYIWLYILIYRFTSLPVIMRIIVLNNTIEFHIIPHRKRYFVSHSRLIRYYPKKTFLLFKSSASKPFFLTKDHQNMLTALESLLQSNTKWYKIL